MAICTIFCVFMGCASSNSVQTPSKKEINHLVCLPERNSLIFIGVSGPQLKLEDEIEAAREDAAKKVSMYNGLYASFISIQGTGTNALDYFADSSVQVSYDTQLDRYKEKLSYDPRRDISYGNGVMFIRFSYPGGFPAKIDYSSANETDGSPGWIRRPPLEINGYMAQVGFARRQQRLRDTIIKSSEDAITGLVARSSSSLNTTDSSHNDVATSVITQQSSGRLNNFLILETWIDPENLSVWTLTIAKSGN